MKKKKKKRFIKDMLNKQEEEEEEKSYVGPRGPQKKSVRSFRFPSTLADSTLIILFVGKFMDFFWGGGDENKNNLE